MDNLPFELEALEHAENYQKWVVGAVKKNLGKRIFEFGAGTGNLSRWLPVNELLYVTETDPQLFQRLQNRFESKTNERIKIEKLEVNAQTLMGLQEYNFDTIISFNVLEHIEDDFTTLESLCGLLRKSKASGPKRIVCVVPAHSWAFGEMDRFFGHYRRYTKSRFSEFVKTRAPDFQISGRYLNVVGLPGWVWMGRVLKLQKFNLRSVEIFEKICPIVKPVDDFLHKILRLPLGQSLLITLTQKPLGEQK